jgi:hypothetical protein
MEGRCGLAAVRLSPVVGRGRRRRRGSSEAIAATYPREEAVQMTEIHLPPKVHLLSLTGISCEAQ